MTIERIAKCLATGCFTAAALSAIMAMWSWSTGHQLLVIIHLSLTAINIVVGDMNLKIAQDLRR